MKTECPHCGQHYEVEENFAGQNVECSQCGKAFTVSAPEKTRRCPMCGEEILAVAKKCKHCGELLDDAGQPIQKKSRAAYILFGLFFGGLGAHNCYIGKSTAGMCEALVWVLGLVIWWVGGASGMLPLQICILLWGGLGLWVIWELLTVTHDADGNSMQ